MLSEAKAVYLSTRKKHDQLFNTYVMRPIASVAVVALAKTRVTPNQVTLVSLAFFVVSAGLLVGLETWLGGVIALAVLELSYMFDCADGMLARHKKIASKEGHLFDFFTDESKAILLCGAIAVRLWRTGGYSPEYRLREPGDVLFLLVGLAGVIVIASATSLTNFVRRPELSGKETPVEAHYEANATDAKQSPAQLIQTFLKWLNHYPSHLYLFALLGRLDVFFWIYVLLNTLYLARGWLGLILRFGRGR